VDRWLVEDPRTASSFEATASHEGILETLRGLLGGWGATRLTVYTTPTGRLAVQLCLDDAHRGPGPCVRAILLTGGD
jgi:hypothetical protein